MAVNTSTGLFDDATAAAVASFQDQRGLRADGRVRRRHLAGADRGRLDASGDRVLLLTAPQLRGDDVVSLQQALNHLGFDCGRPDGILGPATIRALVDFQRNSGINRGRCVRSDDGRQAGVAPPSEWQRPWCGADPGERVGDRIEHAGLLAGGRRSVRRA